MLNVIVSFNIVYLRLNTGPSLLIQVALNLIIGVGRFNSWSNKWGFLLFLSSIYKSVSSASFMKKLIKDILLY